MKSLTFALLVASTNATTMIAKNRCNIDRTAKTGDTVEKGPDGSTNDAAVNTWNPVQLKSDSATPFADGGDAAACLTSAVAAHNTSNDKGTNTYCAEWVKDGVSAGVNSCYLYDIVATTVAEAAAVVASGDYASGGDDAAATVIVDDSGSKAKTIKPADNSANDKMKAGTGKNDDAKITWGAAPVKGYREANKSRINTPYACQ